MGNFFAIVIVCFLMIVAFAWMAHSAEATKLAQMSDEERRQYLEKKRQDAQARAAKLADITRGPVNRAMICPHCQTQGRVRTKAVKQKKGISGGKAAAAILTAGTSILATGLSRKESLTEAFCENCNSTWRF